MPHWTKVKERLPTCDGRQFIAKNSNGYCACVTSLVLYNDGRCFGIDTTPEDATFPISEVVEWTEIPEAPCPKP